MRKELSEAARRQLREAALLHQPWQYATGPRTPEGKARASANGRYQQTSSQSKREMRAQLADIRAFIDYLRQTRSEL